MLPHRLGQRFSSCTARNAPEMLNASLGISFQQQRLENITGTAVVNTRNYRTTTKEREFIGSARFRVSLVLMFLLVTALKL